MFGPFNKGVSMKTIIVLALLSSSVYGRELVCNLNEGSTRVMKRSDIVENGVTELKFENRAGVNINALAQNESVTLTVEVDGNKFRTSDTEVNLSFEMIGKEPMSISCRITKEPYYCAPVSN